MLFLLRGGLVAVGGFCEGYAYYCMGGGKYVGGREAAAVLLRWRARTQQNATRPNINAPMMATPAAMPSIAT